MLKPIMVKEDYYFKRTFYQVGRRILIKNWDKINNKLDASYYTLYESTGWDAWQEWQDPQNPVPVTCVRLIRFSSPCMVGCEAAARGMMRKIGKTMWLGRRFLEDLMMVFSGKIQQSRENELLKE